MALDVADFNASWLKAWTNKDVPRLLAFYSADAIYKDLQVPDGLRGQDALGAYLKGLFAQTPPMRYEPHEIWPTHDGFCGRWYCTIDGADGAKTYLRGFDLVVLKDERIALNEVYVHPVTDLP
ncbi:MAG: nuclear transport factor 2 family protein [Parvibaculum sp.]|uniref:nuclear transport factor 2 family protein n=1 Tax=Parvibaculum sp. TaxID=2024848 RepID=UPI002844FCF6|nr:nuclear transport factor 2 family protein [Parvibaculum sp.]MDR3498789.1 nuclear transport factor 2 family protein [Parvibaculum sp.]